MSEPNALQIPATVAGDPKATEIARIWAAHGQQHVQLRSGVWEDPGSWGIMLVDLARHVANAYEQDGRGDYFEVLSRIHDIFEAEWNSPTDIARGKLTQEPSSEDPNA